jgi:predicted RND superfamily exporter protein
MVAFIHAWAEFVVARRAAILVATLLLLPLIILSGGTIPFDNSTQRYFLSDDPALIDYDSLYENFGDNEYLLVGIEAGAGEQDIFTADTLAALAAISDFLDFHPHVTQMRSLSNYQFISGDRDALNTDYLIDDIHSLASEPAEIAQVKETLAEEELALGTLITEDYRHTRIAARVEYSPDSSAIKVELVQDLYAFIESELAPSEAYALHLSGYPVANEQFESLSATDTSVLIPIMIVVMIVVLYLSFRSVVATMVPWLVIAAGLLSVLEIQYYIGIPHTTIDSAALPSTLIIIGIGLSVHVLLEYFHFAIVEGTGKQAVALAIRAIWLPAFFTAVTTSAGFLALSTARLLPIREFSLLGAIGPLLLFLFALTSLPAALSYVTKLPASTKLVLQDGFLTHLTRKIPDFVRRQRVPILTIGALLVLFSIWNLPNIRVDTNYITLFKEDNPARQDIVYFDDTFRGMMTLDIVLDSSTLEGVKDPTFLEEVASIQAWLEGAPEPWTHKLAPRFPQGDQPGPQC